MSALYYVKRRIKMRIKNVSNAETIRSLLARVSKMDSWGLFPGIRTHAWRACGYRGTPTKEFHALFDIVLCQFQRDWKVRWQHGV